MEALTQKNFWIGATGYLSDTADRLVEPDGRCGIAVYVNSSRCSNLRCASYFLEVLTSGWRACRKNFVPVSPFHYGKDGRLHVVFMGSGYYAAQVHVCCH